MKILLDECVTKKLKKYFSKTHHLLTVSEMNWNGLKNGILMNAAINNGFNILLTIDKNMMYQQNMNNYKITIVVLNSATSKIEELKDFIPAFEKAIETFEANKAYLLEK